MGFKIIWFALVFVFSVLSQFSIAQATVVEVVENNGHYMLKKDGKPYYIKGAGAKSNFRLLAASGANSVRLWSTNFPDLLDSAHHYGMTVSLGLYVRPERTGMDYNDPYAVKGQIEQLKREVLRYKDHPALLLWGIGNEMDLRYTNYKVWETVEALAKFIHEVDPNHPTMTVIAGLDPAKAYLISTYCPSIDILGVNAYGSIENTPINIKKFNWNKPYVVTEWGVNGPFEASTTEWGAKKEPPNGLKATQRQRRYEDLITKDTTYCLGSYCFLWGQKQESTATWHGMFLNDGSPTEAIDVMHYCWSGNWPLSRAPSIVNIVLEGMDWTQDHRFNSANTATLKLELSVQSNNNDVIIANYELYPETFSKKIGGDVQKRPKSIPLHSIGQTDTELTFRTPEQKGAYRIFARIQNSKGQSSVANIPFIVE